MLERRKCRLSHSWAPTLNPPFSLVEGHLFGIFVRIINPSKTTLPAAAVLGRFLPNPKLKLREQLAEVCRFRHMSHRTEQACWHWMKGFILFQGKRHPREMGAAEVQAYLSHLAVARDVAVATQRQALNAIVFLYRDVLNLELGLIGEIEKPQRPVKLPTVLTKEEVRASRKTCERLEPSGGGQGTARPTNWGGRDLKASPG